MPTPDVKHWPPFKKVGTTIKTRSSGDKLDMQGAAINNILDPVDDGDAVNLRSLIDRMSVGINYWLGNGTLSASLTDSETALTETPNADPDTLTNITFKSAVADTPTPLTIVNGAIIEVHFKAKATATAGLYPTTLKCQLGYVDADGTSNFTQIGADSDATSALTTTATEYDLHIHVSAETVVPAGKRLWLKFISDSTLSGAGYPEVNVYYNGVKNHIAFGVSASILGNYLQKSGGTMTGKVTLAGRDEVAKTYTPATGAQTVALDCSVNNHHVVTGHADGTAMTFTITGATNNQPFIVSILQGATTPSTISAWFSTVRWAGGSAPTLTATVNKRDTFGFIRTGADTYDGFVIGQNA